MTKISARVSQNQSKNCIKSVETCIKYDAEQKTTAIYSGECLIDLNTTQAAIRAGYSKRTANRIATENLTKPVIEVAIESAMKERAKENLPKPPIRQDEISLASLYHEFFYDYYPGPESPYFKGKGDMEFHKVGREWGENKQTKKKGVAFLCLTP